MTIRRPKDRSGRASQRSFVRESGLQRNWASMWLLSKEKEKDAWPVRSPGTDESAQEDVSSLAIEGELETCSASNSGSSGLDRQADAEGEESTAAARDEMTEQPTQDGFTHEDSDLVVPTLQLSASEDSYPIEASTEESAEPTFDDNEAGGSGNHSSGDHSSGNHSLMRHLADLRVTLRFHRSNLYLVAAVFVAALALFWPTAGSTRRAALSPWERALVALGLAEAPEPAVRLQGDPSVEVWIDPHTALYYCPGEELYGKTADGRLSSQREAQMERFEPAGRSTCE